MEFVRCLERRLARFRAEENLSEETLRWLGEQRRTAPSEKPDGRWEALLRGRLGDRVEILRAKLAALFDLVVRASSIVECINNLWRPYFFLRQQVGTRFLPLLQFYLNTRKYRRSGRKERVGKSPLELLTGQAHPHWLDILEVLDAEATAVRAVEEASVA